LVREYAKEWSLALGREMEILTFGRSGLPLLVFPTSMGRFYQWEDFGMIEALRDRIEGGRVQLWCVDSVDDESWYSEQKAPRARVARHLEYERYLVEEVIPRMPGPPVAVGTSFGALHALLLALRHPNQVSGFIGLSGSYDTSRWLDGHFDDEVFYTNPLMFLPGLGDEAYLGPLRGMRKKVIATGHEDPNVADSVLAGNLLREKGVDLTLDLWPGWSHDWPYWKEMMRSYV
jgi:esterase/lipase superfamily enzyme